MMVIKCGRLQKEEEWSEYGRVCNFDCRPKSVSKPSLPEGSRVAVEAKLTKGNIWQLIAESYASLMLMQDVMAVAHTDTRATGG
jgi:hypothetical protein